MQKNIKSSATTGLYIVIVIGILVLINVISSQLFGRVDLTKNGMYSLSDASIQMMQSLDDQVLAKAYFTSDLPAPYSNHTRFVQDLFEEYSAYSKGNFKFEFIDPGEDENIKNELMLLGIPPVQIQEIQNDKFQVKQAFIGIVFYYADKKEVLPVIKTTKGLEYEITSTIRKLTAERLKTVGFLTGHDEPDASKEMTRAMEFIQKHHKTTSVNLLEKKASALDDVDTLVIIDPLKKFEEEELYYIDQFLMKGKTIGFFTDALNVDIRAFRASAINTGLDKLMKHYGINVNTNLIGDLQNKRINVATNQGMFRVSNIINYPLIPVVTDFDKDSPLTSSLDALSFPYVSSLEIAADTDKLNFTVLARTSSRSWLQEGTYEISPMGNLSPGPDAKTGPFPVLAMSQGKYKSFFASQMAESTSNIPEWINPKSFIQESPNTRIIVSGDGSFMLDEYFDPANVIFFADSIDWLMQDNAMISIRGRGLENKPISDLDGWERNLLKYLNLIGVPFIFIAFGLIRWSIRRARRRGFQLAFK